MTSKTADYLIKTSRFVKKATEDKDPFIAVHFSREDDYFTGVHEGMDKLDAMIIIGELVKHFEIDETLLSTALTITK